MNSKLFSQAVRCLCIGMISSASAISAISDTTERGGSIDNEGSVSVSAMNVPYSSLASEEARGNFVELARTFARDIENSKTLSDVSLVRKWIDEVMQPGVARLVSTFPVRIMPTRVGGVQTDIIVPVGGVAKSQNRRVLINLHGGAFTIGAGLGGQMESIPIASMGGFRVISVDYRQGPENKYPAASEDVEAVYRALLKEGYLPRNIGIYGCSAGGILAAQATARFQHSGLPRPGAIGIFGAGALVSMSGDSRTMGFVLSALQQLPAPRDDASERLPYFDDPDIDLRDPLISPVYSPSVLAGFPATLVMSGTRDMMLSNAVYTHAQLMKQGVDAHLHVWEGATHCSFAAPIADPRVAETREAWDVIVKFFDRYLGH